MRDLSSARACFRTCGCVEYSLVQNMLVVCEYVKAYVFSGTLIVALLLLLCLTAGFSIIATICMPTVKVNSIFNLGCQSMKK